MDRMDGMDSMDCTQRVHTVHPVHESVIFRYERRAMSGVRAGVFFNHAPLSQ